MTTTDTTEFSTGPAATSDTATMSMEEVTDAAIEAAVRELVPVAGTRACAAVGRARATHYRYHRVGPAPTPKPRAQPRRQPRALSADERAEALNSARFVDAAPATV